MMVVNIAITGNFEYNPLNGKMVLQKPKISKDKNEEKKYQTKKSFFFDITFLRHVIHWGLPIFNQNCGNGSDEGGRGITIQRPLVPSERHYRRSSTHQSIQPFFFCLFHLSLFPLLSLECFEGSKIKSPLHTE